MKGRILDTSALVDIATGRTHYGRALVRAAVDHIIPLGIPTTALAAAWAVTDPKARLSLSVLTQPRLSLSVLTQPRLSLSVLTQLSITVMLPLDTADAGAVGEILEQPVQAGGHVDVVAGHVAAAGRDRAWPIVSDRGAQLHTLVADLAIESLP